VRANIKEQCSGPALDRRVDYKNRMDIKVLSVNLNIEE
jgi:hypothetical protein